MKMFEEKPKFASILSIAGAVLMFINALLVGINGGPLIVSSATVKSPDDVLGSNLAFWFRVSFGFKGMVEGTWTLVWLIAAFVLLYCAIRLYIKPMERKILCMVIGLLSALSIVYGGGFILGAILGVLGAGVGYEWPTKLQNVFFYRVMQAAKLDSNLYQNLKNDRDALRHAAYGIVLFNILSGIGGGLYTLSVQRIQGAVSSDIPFRTILLGATPMDISIITTIVLNVGVAVLKWITLSFIIYIIAIGLLERKQTLSNIAAVTAFAYVPISFQLFMPFLLTSEPYLSLTWPLVIYIITNIWMVLVLLVGIKQTLEISLGKTLGILCISSAAYILIRETFYSTLVIPNILQIGFQPQIITLAVVSSLIIGSVLFGTYSKH